MNPRYKGASPGDVALSLRRPVRKKRVVRNGIPTNDLVLTASTGGNESIFPQILKLYVGPGSTIADVTYGKGVFWKRVSPTLYKVLPTDIQTGVDCRNLPYEDGTIDCVVFDPPYMHSPGGTAHSTHSPFEEYYRNNGNGGRVDSKYHEAVIAVYRDGGIEAHRVLRETGVMIVKCQDEVCANKQRFTHVEIMEIYMDAGFVAEDLFVVVRNNRPGVSRIVKQVHARKNHSYFLVLWKNNGRKRRWTPPE